MYHVVVCPCPMAIYMFEIVKKCKISLPAQNQVSGECYRTVILWLLLLISTKVVWQGRVVNLRPIVLEMHHITILQWKQSGHYHLLQTWLDQSILPYSATAVLWSGPYHLSTRQDWTFCGWLYWVYYWLVREKIVQFYSRIYMLSVWPGGKPSCVWRITHESTGS